MERFQQLVENIHEVFYIYSPDWKRIEYISPLYESLWGHTCKSLYEQPLSFIDCIHPDDREQVIKVRHKTETKGIRSEAEYRVIRPDDTTRWIHDRNFIVYDIAGKPSRIVGIADDITERKLSEQQMNLQYNITKIISESANIDEAISYVIQVICEKTEWDMGAFWVHDKINNQLYCDNIWHKPSVNVPEFLAICKRTASTPGTGFIGRIFTSGEPIWNVDIISDTYFQRRHIAKSEGINSAFGFPIKIESEKIGVLEFFSKQARNPDDGLLNIITSISRQIGQFILRKQAEDEIKHRIDFESVVARVSSRFVNISDFDVAVNESLADIGKFSGADRSYTYSSSAKTAPSWIIHMNGAIKGYRQK
ncbi:MAG TPA: PAS domain-containing protein [Chitinophagaceae bacterium]|nr:MAG: hypothetical protein A2W74_00100 [Planctomycetes bacterium RIFCSPLOWO2_12_38_17]HKZ64992.1 PAS domain-containing protein [Chitinophagaceae bacterium]